MRGALPFNRFSSLQALIQSEDVVCLSSQSWADVQPVYGATFAEMARHWRVFFVEPDAVSQISQLKATQSAHTPAEQRPVAACVQQGPWGVWMVHLSAKHLNAQQAQPSPYSTLRKRRLLSELLHEASVYEPVIWCLDANVVTLAQGLPAALTVFSGDALPHQQISMNNPADTVRKWADLVLHQKAFGDPEIPHAPSGLQVIMNALSSRLAMAA